MGVPQTKQCLSIVYFCVIALKNNCLQGHITFSIRVGKRLSKKVK